MKLSDKDLERLAKTVAKELGNDWFSDEIKIWFVPTTGDVCCLNSEDDLVLFYDWPTFGLIIEKMKGMGWTSWHYTDPDFYFWDDALVREVIGINENVIIACCLAFLEASVKPFKPGVTMIYDVKVYNAKGKLIKTVESEVLIKRLYEEADIKARQPNVESGINRGLRLRACVHCRQLFSSNQKNPQYCKAPDCRREYHRQHQIKRRKKEAGGL
ncbi:MAG: hypothetical protein OEY89_02470 [Gammaproteobacteria bacterium]|nr:hypothetical protein [Gammaproteobacteria bacterium]